MPRALRRVREACKYKVRKWDETREWTSRDADGNIEHHSSTTWYIERKLRIVRHPDAVPDEAVAAPGAGKGQIAEPVDYLTIADDVDLCGRA